MISDILSDAVDGIELWLNDYPEVYGSMEQEIRDLVGKMEVVRRKLDTPPSVTSPPAGSTGSMPGSGQ